MGYRCDNIGLVLAYLPSGSTDITASTTLFTIMFTTIILVYSLKCMCIPIVASIGFCVSELHAHLCPYRNVWPEAVSCCFTRTTMFTMLFTY